MANVFCRAPIALVHRAGWSTWRTRNAFNPYSTASQNLDVGLHTIRRRAQHLPLLQTLHPERLKPSDFIDVSNREKFPVYLDGDRTHISYTSFAARRIPFPPDTRGFLYYHHDCDLPPTAGEIRLRLTAAPDPRLFEDGRDLVGPRGVEPWSIDLFQMMEPAYAPMRNMLLREGLCSPSLLYELEKGFTGHRPMNDVQKLYYLEQPFVADLGCWNLTLRVFGPSSISHVSVQRLFMDFRASHQSLPYSGRVLLRFERSTLPEHDGTNTLVIRVLKVLEPIKCRIPGYDMRLPIPEAGKLVETYKAGRKLTVYAVDLAKPPLFLTNLTVLVGEPGPPAPTSPTAHVLRRFHQPSTASSLSPSSKSPRKLVSRTIQTLQPDRLTASDFIDLSDLTRRIIHVTSRCGTYSGVRVEYYNGHFTRHKTQAHLPFPSNARGFLYYHNDPTLPHTTGCIRFRLTSASDPALFTSGDDLLGRNGLPWSISLFQLATQSKYAAFKSKVVEEGLIAASAMREATEGWGGNPSRCKFWITTQSLHYLEQPFGVNVAGHTRSLAVFTPSRTGSVMVVQLFWDMRRRVLAPPYTGRVLVRFERSALPEHAHGRFLVVRVLKIVEPIEVAIPGYDMWFPVPKEGSLVQRHAGKKTVPLSIDLDNPRHGLKDLALLA
ncbi:hypothetical protein LshimejAT787_1302250 [Lyophyllum shimeji]|uniref:Uncharacterized protein n=1 Tax=Lyophyllum shimeji TaxID=47721 RepID=A0A9P3PXD0_LYOSH|nr:hypothetical protein LshimejAT787_1302250 [Lyophyllum shimeji]